MIALIDYGSGNIRAIANILGRLEIPALVASCPEHLDGATKIILPGVGAFDQAMEHLNNSGLRNALNQKVLDEQVPFLGICVGMQLLARRSDEGTLPGLGWIEADVRKFDDERFAQRTHLPHMGWNDVDIVREHPLFRNLTLEPTFYFLHSYYVKCDRSENVLGETDYGGPFHSALNAGNVFGVQFHPEKSHQNGVRLLQNFAEL